MNRQLIAVLERVVRFLADPVRADDWDEIAILRAEVDSHLELLEAQAALAPTPAGRPELLREACKELAATIHATGGLTVDDDGCDVPVADPEWLDLGAAYLLACEALGYEPQYAPGSEPDAVQPEPVPLRDVFPHPVRSDVVELEPDDPKATVCGTCGRGWDDTVSTSCTPTPSGRCPFEGEHNENDEKETP